MGQENGTVAYRERGELMDDVMRTHRQQVQEKVSIYRFEIASLVLLWVI